METIGMTRRGLANKYGITPQTLSSLLRRLVFSEIPSTAIERDGFFTEIGAEFVGELLSVRGFNVGLLRKQWIAEARVSEKYRHLFNGVEEVEEVQVDVMPQIEVYRGQTAYMASCLPLPELLPNPAMFQPLGEALYQTYYRGFRAVSAAAMSDAARAAMADTADDLNASLAAQLSE